MIKKERDIYTVRFNIVDIIVKYKLEDIFVNFLKLFIEEKFNIKLILYFDNKNQGIAYNFEKDYREILNKLNCKLCANVMEFSWYDIFHVSDIDTRESYKFRNVYSNDNEFICAVFTFISFMKGIKNREEEKNNEGGNNRKQFLRKKTTYKENNLGIKEKI